VQIRPFHYDSLGHRAAITSAAAIPSHHPDLSRPEAFFVTMVESAGKSAP